MCFLYCTYCRQWRPSLSMVSPGLHLPPLKRKGSSNWVSRGIKKTHAHLLPSPELIDDEKNTCRNLCVLVLPNMRPQLFLVEANSTSCPSPWHREPPRNLLDRSKAQLLHGLGVRWLAALTKPCQWCSFSWEILAYRLSENMWKPWEITGLCGCVSAASCES